MMDAAPGGRVAPMTAAPLVSVLMTSYNREAYIAEAIDSVLAQSLGDFELIISDDGSRDQTVAIAEAYARRDPRIRVSINTDNLGDYPNRCQAARLARGEFLKYHDSDDIMYSHCLTVMVEALSAAPTAAFALSAAGAWPGGPCPMLLTPRLAYEREFLGGGLFQPGPASALFRTRVFREFGGFPEAGAASDYLFWMRACAVLNVLLVPGDLFYYRVHGGQERVKPESDLAYARAVGCAWEMLNSPQCPLAAESLERAKRNFAFVQARGIVRELKRGRMSTAAANFRYAGLSAFDWMRYLRAPQHDVAAGTPPRHEARV